MDDLRDNPLTAPDADGSLSDLPTPEPQRDPLSEDELAENMRREAARLRAAVEDTAGAAGEAVDELTAHAPIAPERILRRIDRSVAAMGHDVEQLHADTHRTQRAVQLLALSIAAVAALIMFYALRAAREAATS